jgi:hypothetical protein
MSGFKLGFSQFIKEVEFEADATTKVVMNQVLKIAKDLTPVRSGFLKRSWKLVKHKRMSWSVLNTAHYAKWVENGTPYFSGRHMLKTAVQRTKALRMAEKGAMAAAAKKRGKK